MPHSTRLDQCQAPTRTNEDSSGSGGKTYTWKGKPVTSLRELLAVKRAIKLKAHQANGK